MTRCPSSLYLLGTQGEEWFIMPLSRLNFDIDFIKFPRIFPWSACEDCIFVDSEACYTRALEFRKCRNIL